MYAIEQLTSPAYEPVSLSLVKEWLRLESDDSSLDDVLGVLIKAMREDAENLTHRAFIPRQYRVSLPRWPADSEYGAKICLPFPPLISVDSIKYTDLDGAEQTLSTSLYVAHSEFKPGFVIPAYLATWPSLRFSPNSVRVTFTAGYSPGSPPDEASYQEVMPRQLQLWMQTKVATMDLNREQLVRGTVASKIPRDFSDALLDSLVIGTRLF